MSPMTIPKGLDRFSDENDFVEKSLIPLFGRLGLEIVANHHGKSEAGMDLIVGEIDRLGHVRYLGIQAKYVSSISLGESHGLVQDATEAFAQGFRHPQTGDTQKISSFIAVNAGSVSDQAREFFFAKLLAAHSANVRILEGRDLIALGHAAAIRSSDIHSRLRGLKFECTRIVSTLDRIVPELQAISSGQVTKFFYPTDRLQTVALASWLAAPEALADLSLDAVADLYSSASAFNRSLDESGASPLQTVVSVLVPAHKAVQMSDPTRKAAMAIVDSIDITFSKLPVRQLI